MILPILFSAPMVRAILAGRKTQTRRLWRGQWAKVQPGDRLWVREAWRLAKINGDHPGHFVTVQYREGYGVLDYRGDWREFYATLIAGEQWSSPSSTGIRWGRWRPSIHMPRWASRLTLRVTKVRRQRLWDITHDDCHAEGMEFYAKPNEWEDAVKVFKRAWEALNARRAPWYLNPEVAAVSFEVIRGNVEGVKHD